MVFACAKIVSRNRAKFKSCMASKYMYNEPWDSPLNILHYIHTQGVEFGA
jgi:hypothetical protein